MMDRGVMPAADVLNLLLAIIAGVLAITGWFQKRWMDRVDKLLEALTKKNEEIAAAQVASNSRILALEVFCAASHGTARREHSRSASD